MHACRTYLRDACGLASAREPSYQKVVLRAKRLLHRLHLA
jgi:hypothetical protein